ncbi:hypothetical protein [Catenulispora sp. GAS73]|uniref:hypothetical protein n=1 Tax=Catenulispora sp. GAS73 TaxID=3156269 RepID=UPI003517E5FD
MSSSESSGFSSTASSAVQSPYNGFGAWRSSSALTNVATRFETLSNVPAYP